jgi:hypothetical protein
MATIDGNSLFPQDIKVVGRPIRTPKTAFGMTTFSNNNQFVSTTISGATTENPEFDGLRRGTIGSYWNPKLLTANKVPEDR